MLSVDEKLVEQIDDEDEDEYEDEDEDETSFTHSSTYTDAVNEYRKHIKICDARDMVEMAESGSEKKISISTYISWGLGIILIVLLLTGKFDKLAHTLSGGAFGNPDSQYVVETQKEVVSKGDYSTGNRSKAENSNIDVEEDNADSYSVMSEEEDSVFCKTFYYEGYDYYAYLTLYRKAEGDRIGSIMIGYFGEPSDEYDLYQEGHFWYYVDANGKNKLYIYDDSFSLYVDESERETDLLRLVGLCGINGEIQYKGTDGAY